MKKRILSFLLSVAILMSVIPWQTTARAATTGGSCGENATWAFDETTGTLTISGTGDMYAYTTHSDVPWTAEDILSVEIGEGITSVSNYAFYYGIKLEKISFPEGLTKIGEYAFDNCRALAEIVLPDSVTSIGPYAFRDCLSLSNVNIPENVTVLEKGVFNGCSGLAEITLPGNLTTLKDHAFSETAITSITIPNSVTSIGEYVFLDCANLSSITIPEGITSLEYGVFSNCGSLTHVTLPSTLTTIGDSVFSGSGIVNIDIPESVTSIGNWVFMDCYDLTGSIIIPDGVPNLGESAFYNCSSLIEVVIPDSVTIISWYAFEGCTSLTDVYYSGTEEEWNAITIGTYNEGLDNATIHYNVYIPGINQDSHRVRYLSGWDEAEQKVYFGPDDKIGCYVTEETSSYVLEHMDILLDNYVLVETKMVDDQEILISMEQVWTGTDIVTAVTDTQITIGEDVYDKPADILIPTTCLNQQVLYHTRIGELVDLEILQKKTGYLTYWYEDEYVMKIQSNETSTDSEIYWLSVWSPEESETFLNWSVDEMDKTDVPVNYLMDRNRFVFEITPVVEYREGGFSEDEHGWPVVNWGEVFAYPDGYDIPVWAYFTHAGLASVAEGAMANLVDDPWEAFDWNGNCFGLALLAVAQYKELVDLKPYFSHSGDTLNEFGYDSVDELDGENGFVMYHYEDGSKVRHPIVEKIEQAQAGQEGWAMKMAKRNVKPSECDWLLEYLNKKDPVPLVLGFGGHAVVTETCMKPINIGNGRYLIPLYDCNAPQTPEDLDNPMEWYEYDQSMLYIDTKQGIWGYWYNGAWETTGEGSLEVFVLDELDDSFFDDHYTYEPNVVTLLYEAPPEGFVIFDVNPETGDQTKVFEIVDGTPTLYCEDGEYRPYYESVEDSAETVKGIVTLPLGTYLIKTEGETYLQCMYDNDIFVAGADNGIEVLLDTEGDELTVTGTQEETAISAIHTSSEVDFCTGVEAAVGTGTNVTLSTHSEAKTAEIATNANPDSITMLHAVDGELIDITPDMIHRHEKLTYVEAAEPQCEIPGNVAHYLCGCGKCFADAEACELLTTVRVPALEHVWEKVDDITKTCTLCGITVKGYRITLDAAVAGQTDSVWIDGVEYSATLDGSEYYVDVEGTTATNLVVYTYNDPAAENVHTQYPIGMKAWMLRFEDGAYTATYVPEFDDLLQYSGSSIRIVGVKGIRMITSITKANKQALTGKGLAGYTLVEYGTALAWASDVESGNGLILGEEYTKSNYAYRKDVADPVFKTTSTLMQYTNVLVGFSDDQCIPDIAMRPYIILEDAEGNQVTIYGGVIYRSVGYIAYQNRNAFKPGSNAYDYVWSIIHHVYDDQFDADYKG